MAGVAFKKITTYKQQLAGPWRPPKRRYVFCLYHFRTLKINRKAANDLTQLLRNLREKSLSVRTRYYLARIELNLE